MSAQSKIVLIWFYLMHNDNRKYSSTTVLDRISRIFPLKVRDTILFDNSLQTEALQSLIKPMNNCLVQTDMQTNDFKQLTESLTKFNSNLKSNVSGLFSPDIDHHPDTRQQYYVRLLHEIRSSLEKHQKNSKTHGKVLTHFYSLFPEFAPLPEPGTAQSILSPSLQSSTNNITKETSEEATQNPTPMDTTEEDKKTVSEIQDSGALREDLASEPKYPLRKKVDLLPHPLEFCDPQSLYYKYWKTIDHPNKHPDTPFQ